MNQGLRSVLFNTTHNSISRMEQTKIAFQFVLMTVCSLLMGVLFAGVLSDQIYADKMSLVSSHFEKIFVDCDRIYEYFLCIFSYAVSDIICILIIFAVSFAIFNYVISDFVLIYSGFRVGIALSFLFSFISNVEYTYNIGWIKYLVFLFFKVAILVLLLDYSYRAALYSGNLKKTSSIGRPNLKFKVLLPFLVSSFARMGAVIILNGLYCGLIFFLK